MRGLFMGASMRELTKEETEVLQRHVRYIETGGKEGSRADLRWSDLSEADLSDADLREADLSGADLRWSDLRGANLRGANLRGADLRWANLRWANLREADLRDADLSGADLSEANLRGADLDFACWPLWRGSTKVTADDRLVAQLLFHVTRLDVSHCSGGVREAIEHIRGMAVSDLFCEYGGGSGGQDFCDDSGSGWGGGSGGGSGCGSGSGGSGDNGSE